MCPGICRIWEQLEGRDHPGDPQTTQGLYKNSHHFQQTVGLDLNLSVSSGALEISAAVF